MRCWILGDFDTLCPEGTGFKPNPDTVVIEGMLYLK